MIWRGALTPRRSPVTIAMGVGSLRTDGVGRLGVAIAVAIGFAGASLLGACSGEGPTPSTKAGADRPQRPATAAGEDAAAARPHIEELSEPLLVWAAATPETGDAPLSVRFTADLEGGTPPFAITWTFGDTATSTERTPAHTYAAPGAYRAELQVADAAGDADSDWVEITVRPVTPAAPPPAR